MMSTAKQSLVNIGCIGVSGYLGFLTEALLARAATWWQTTELRRPRS